MNVSVYQAAAALGASSQWQELIANNLASSSVPGFKKQDISFEAVQSGLSAAGDSMGFPVSMPKASSTTNFQAGALRLTGSNMDFALNGPGFFEVQLPSGASAYTRDGEFRLSPDGRLVTKSGLAVSGEGGPIQLDPANGRPISVAATGEISQGTDLVGTLRMVEFDNPARLTPVGDGLFLPAGQAVQPNPAAATSVRQGYLESSNASALTEMSQLITAMRMFESNQRVVQIQDDRVGKAIVALGSPS